MCKSLCKNEIEITKERISHFSFPSHRNLQQNFPKGNSLWDMKQKIFVECKMKSSHISTYNIVTFSDTCFPFAGKCFSSHNFVVTKRKLRHSFSHEIMLLCSKFSHNEWKIVAFPYSIFSWIAQERKALFIKIFSFVLERLLDTEFLFVICCFKWNFNRISCSWRLSWLIVILVRVQESENCENCYVF